MSQAAAIAAELHRLRPLLDQATGAAADRLRAAITAQNAALVEECRAKLAAIAGKMASWPLARIGGHAVEDLAQEAALALVRHAHRFDPARGRTFDQFIHKCLYGGVLNALLRQNSLVHAPLNEKTAAEDFGLTEQHRKALGTRRWPRAADGQLLDVPSRPRGLAAEDLDELDRALALLPADQRELLCLRYLEGARVDRLAAQLGVTRQTIYNLTRRALQQLRRWYRRGAAP